MSEENLQQQDEFSLADLSDLDVSGIDEIRFEQLPAGVFDFKCIAAELSEGTNKEDEKIFYLESKFEVMEVISLLEGGDADAVKGKIHTERKNIEPAKAEEGIGRIRAFITDLGLDSAGKLGDIVGSMVGHEFRSKIVRRPNKNDPSIIYANLQLDKPKAA